MYFFHTNCFLTVLSYIQNEWKRNFNVSWLLGRNEKIKNGKYIKLMPFTKKKRRKDEKWRLKRSCFPFVCKVFITQDQG